VSATHNSGSPCRRIKRSRASSSRTFGDRYALPPAQNVSPAWRTPAYKFSQDAHRDTEAAAAGEIMRYAWEKNGRHVWGIAGWCMMQSRSEYVGVVSALKWTGH